MGLFPHLQKSRLATNKIIFKTEKKEMAAFPKDFARQQPLYVRYAWAFQNYNEKGEALPYDIWGLTNIA